MKRFHYCELNQAQPLFREHTQIYMSPPMHGAELLDRIPKIRSIREEISQVIWEQNSHINRVRLLVNQFKAEIGYH